MKRFLNKYFLTAISSFIVMSAANAQDFSTEAVSTVTGEELYGIAASNLSNSMVGAIPGFTLIPGFGHVGNDTARWLIRGIGSYGSGNFNSAAIFVDGFEVTQEYFTSMSAAEIESIQILKDAAALTIYGDNSDNGVILVTTRRGKEGPSNVRVRMRYGFQAPTVINKPLGAYDYSNLYNQAVSNDALAWTPKYKDYQLEDILNGYGPDVDWYSEVLSDMGSYTDGDMVFSGGSKNARYNLTFGYLNNQGLLNVANTDLTKNLSYERFNMRANLDFNLFDFFEVKVDIGGRLEYKYRPNYDINSLFSNLNRIPANAYNVYDDEEKTKFSGTAIYPDNPYASINSLGWVENKFRILQGNFELKEKLDVLVKGLYIQESFSFYSYTMSHYSKTRDYARFNYGVQTTTNQNTTITASPYGSDGMKDWKQGKLTVGYNNSFEDDHKVSAALTAHISAFQGDGYFEYNNHYVNYYATAKYSYADKYVASLGLSLFGNDAYAPGNRYNFYSSVSGAWIASKEEFLKNSHVVNFLKIRASAGLTGNSYTTATSSLSSLGFDSNGRYLFNSYYTYSRAGSFYMGSNGGVWQNSYVPLFIPNEDLHPERSLKLNLGVDATLFSGLSLTADIFYDKTTDIITVDNGLMSYLGQRNYIANLGEMTNYGAEFLATYQGKAGDFCYAVTGSMSYAHNVIDYMSEIPTANPFSAQTGKPYGTFIGLVSDGFYDIDDFTSDGTLKEGLDVPAFGRVQPGDVKYLDLDGNHIIDQNDVQQIGKSWVPELVYTLGARFDFKGFDFSFLFQGFGGVSYNLLDNAAMMKPLMNNANVFKTAKEAWVYYPDQNLDNRATAKYPRLTLEGNDNNYRTSSMWIVDADYLRLRNIELGYTYKENVRVFVSGQNLLTISGLLREYNLDPESPNGYYPAVKSVIVGLNLSF